MSYLSYLLLGLAIVLEVCGVTSMKLSDGFKHVTPSVLMFLFYGACFGVFVLALRRIDVSVAYAIWAGLGTALVAVVGIVHFKEPSSPGKLVSLGLIIAGVVGLHLFGGARER